MYESADGITKIEVKMQDETVWLSIDQMAELFGRDKSTISRHIKNVFEELCFGDPSKYNILKINKGSHNKIGPDFYEDDIMKSNNTFYTYTNIPKEEITDLGSLKKFIV